MTATGRSVSQVGAVNGRTVRQACRWPGCVHRRRRGRLRRAPSPGSRAGPRRRVGRVTCSPSPTGAAVPQPGSPKSFWPSSAPAESASSILAVLRWDRRDEVCEHAPGRVRILAQQSQLLRTLGYPRPFQRRYLVTTLPGIALRDRGAFGEGRTAQLQAGRGGVGRPGGRHITPTGVPGAFRTGRTVPCLVGHRRLLSRLSRVGVPFSRSLVRVTQTCGTSPHHDDVFAAGPS